VRNVVVAAERDVELTAMVEAAEAIVAGAVQVVEERGGLGGLVLPACPQLVEPVAISVVQTFVVQHRNADHETALEPSVEVDDVRVDVVQQGAPRHDPESDCETAREGLNQTPACVRLPEREEIRQLPPLPSCPFEGGPN